MEKLKRSGMVLIDSEKIMFLVMNPYGGFSQNVKYDRSWVDDINKATVFGSKREIRALDNYKDLEKDDVRYQFLPVSVVTTRLVEIEGD